MGISPPDYPTFRHEFPPDWGDNGLKKESLQMRPLKWLCLPLITGALLTSVQAQPTISNPGGITKESTAPAIFVNRETRQTSFDGLAGHFPRAGACSPQQANKEIQESIQSFFKEPERKITLLGHPPRLHSPDVISTCLGPNIPKPQSSIIAEDIPVNIPTSICAAGPMPPLVTPKVPPFRHLSKEEFFATTFLTTPLSLTQGQWRLADPDLLWKFGLQRN